MKFIARQVIHRGDKVSPSLHTAMPRGMGDPFPVSLGIGQKGGAGAAETNRAPNAALTPPYSAECPWHGVKNFIYPMAAI